MYGLNPYGFE